MFRNMNSSYRDRIYNRYYEVLGKFAQIEDIRKEYLYRSKLFDLNFKMLLPEDRTKKILELGCGSGFFLKYLDDNGYKNCTGVDLSEQEGHRASSLNVSHILRANFVDFLKETNDKFDVICAFHVIEHFFKDEIMHLLDIILTRLNPNGMIIIEVPNAGSPLLGSLNRYVDFTHEVGFTPLSLQSILLTCGFKGVKILPRKDFTAYARLLFKILNHFLHSYISRYAYFEGGIIGIGYKME